LVSFKKHQIHQNRLILHAPNFRILAPVFYNTIDATIGRMVKATYLVVNVPHQKISKHLKCSRHQQACITDYFSQLDI
jgi:hypothetical protein